MKTKSNTLDSTSADNIAENKTPSRFAKVSRILLATLCVSLVSAAAPSALAAIPNGVYQFTSSTGSVKFDGNTISLPQSAVKRIAGVLNGEITVRNKTLDLNKNATKKIVYELGNDLNFDATASVTGPNSITLVKEGSIYIGSTEGRIVTSFEGNFHGETFSGELRTDLTAKVEGKILRLTIKFSGETLGSGFSGKLVIVAKR